MVTVPTQQLANNTAYFKLTASRIASSVFLQPRSTIINNSVNKIIHLILFDSIPMHPCMTREALGRTKPDQSPLVTQNPP